MIHIPRFSALALSSLLLLAHSGCARVGPVQLPDPPSEEIRSRFGRIAVTWAPMGPPLQGAVPARGSCDGAGRGAVVGMLVDGQVTLTLMGASVLSGPFWPLLAGGFLGLGIVTLPVYALFGSLYGLGAAPPAEEVQKATEALLEAVRQLDLARCAADRILQRASYSIDEHLERLAPGSPPADFDTLLEVGPPELHFQGPYNVNPTLHLTLVQSATLTRVSDGRLLYKVVFVQRMQQQAVYLDWARTDASLLKMALNGEDRRLGDRVVDEIFLRHPLPTNREWKGVAP